MNVRQKGTQKERKADIKNDRYNNRHPKRNT